MQCHISGERRATGLRSAGTEGVRCAGCRVDEAQIDDPEASKPDDWDEDAPEEIVDATASMPEDWYRMGGAAVSSAPLT